MPQRRTLHLTDEQRRTLVDYRDHDRRPYLRERCAALLKIADGYSPHWVSQQGLLKKRAPDTVYNWMNVYQNEGVVGLTAYQQGGSRRGSL